MNDKYDEFLERVKKDWHSIECAGWSYANNVDIVMAAVEQNGLALRYAGPKVKDTLSVVLTAVKNKGLALQYASENMRSNRLVVLMAVRQDGRAIKYASDWLKADTSIIMEAVKNDGTAIEVLDENCCAEHRHNKQLILLAIKTNPNAIGYADFKLKYDYEFMKKAYLTNPEIVNAFTLRSRERTFLKRDVFNRMVEEGVVPFYELVNTDEYELIKQAESEQTVPKNDEDNARHRQMRKDARQTQ